MGANLENNLVIASAEQVLNCAVLGVEADIFLVTATLPIAIKEGEAEDQSVFRPAGRNENGICLTERAYFSPIEAQGEL